MVLRKCFVERVPSLRDIRKAPSIAYFQGFRVDGICTHDKVLMMREIL
jgi:hypothetical protein